LQLFGMFAFVILGTGAGASFVMQQAVNANLRATIGSAAWAGFVSYLGGTFCMLLLAVALRDALPSTSVVTKSNWWAWSGGFFGAIYIAISIVLVPRLGAAMFVALLITGRMLALLEAGAVSPPAITRYKLADAAEAHRVSESRHLRGKLVFEIR
jgi:transporter family-2 protein